MTWGVDVSGGGGESTEVYSGRTIFERVERSVVGKKVHVSVAPGGDLISDVLIRDVVGPVILIDMGKISTD